MTPFAIVIRWKEEGPSPAATRRSALTSGRCLESTSVHVVPGAEVTVGLRAVLNHETASWGVCVDRHRRRLIVGDVRLDGIEALIAKLGVGKLGDSDLSLVSLAVDRFGEEAPKHLVGDFAFVVWDWGERRVWAARDHFGLRALHYRLLPTGIALATDVGELVDEGGARRIEAEPLTVLSYLLRGRSFRGRTFFRNVGQVRPAHVLIATATSLRETGYWSPPVQAVRRGRYEDYVHEWREIFLEAVRDRLRSAYPIAGHLSGGLDSGSIVGAAHYLAKTSPKQFPTLTTVSAVFPGLDCDETPYIDAVLSQTPLFQAIRFSGCERNSADFDAPMVSGPGLRGAPGTRPLRDLEAAKEVGARVLLIGLGGDEVGWSRGIFRDLMAAFRLLTLGREMIAFGSWERCRRHVPDGIWGVIPSRWETALRGRRLKEETAPAWLGPDLEQIFPETNPSSDRELTFSSNIQREIWRTLTSPEAFGQLDARVVLGAEAGLEVRAPYLDVRLANYVLAIPWQHRLPHGDMRRLQRDSVGVFLPDVVRDRLPKSMFASAVCNQIRLNLQGIREILEARTWISAPFVRQNEVRRVLARNLRHDPEIRRWRSWLAVCRIAAMEAWLRTLSAYTPP